MSNNIVTKDKREVVLYLYEELERAADIQEYKRKVYNRMMCERSEIDVKMCRGRD